MSKQRRTRIRRQGEPTKDQQVEAEKEAEVAAKRAEEEARAAQAAANARRVREVAIAEPTAPEPAVDADALMAIADMDPAELAALMEDATPERNFKVGASVSGTVSRVTEREIFVDLGVKAEAVLDRSDYEGDEAPAIGSAIEGFVTWTSEGSVQLSQRLSGDSADAALEAAFASGMPVEGKVTATNSGGFEVAVGKTRGFCPMSHISRLRNVDPDGYVGQVLEFRIIEMDPRLVLSRRALQDEEAKKKAEAFWGTVAEGQTHKGVVKNVQPFGVFVEVEGVDGLVPKREVGWDDATMASLSPGQTLEVRVLEVNRSEEKLTFSAKDPELSPWNLVGTRFIRGGIYTGTVKKVADFGAFVELSPGLEGLAHVSRFPQGIPKKGSTLDVRILEIDMERQRLSLSPAAEGEKALSPDTVVEGKVSDVLRNGVVLQLDDGRTGWLAANEVELPAGTILAQRFRRGRTVSARVLSVDERRNRVTLSQLERSEEAGWRQEIAAQSSEGFGTMASLLSGLKDKLDS